VSMIKAGRYTRYSREALIAMLEGRYNERRYGLVWEHEGSEADSALNEDFVALDFDPGLSGVPADDRGTAKILPLEQDTRPVAGAFLVPVFIELHRWVHRRVELLADRHTNRCGPCVEHPP
jgi:hypothetical protein